MTELKTDISENGKKFELVFQTDNKEYFEKMQDTARECIDHKPVTQFDRIKAMSVEEMADYFNGIFDCSNCPNDMFLCESKGSVCTKYIKQWLESEVEGE